MNTLYIVVPCYNEQEVINETNKRLTKKLNDLITNDVIDKSSRILYVNDGSKDNTWNMLVDLHANNKLINVINLSRNRGHQNALLAGLMEAYKFADCVISMDADLQDDIEVIDDFIKEYKKGNDVVYGVRKERKKDSFFKKYTAQGFYKFMSLMGVDVIYNHADYRLMSKRALIALSQFKEVNLFLRGLVPLVGYNSSVVYYDRDERFAGESKYPLKKMMSFAIEGITSFTIKPIRLITFLGLFVFLISFIMLVYFVVIHYLGKTVQGWTTLVVSIWALGGLQLLSIGIVGEYIGKIYMETKHRPRYIIEDELINE